MYSSRLTALYANKNSCSSVKVSLALSIGKKSPLS